MRKRKRLTQKQIRAKKDIVKDLNHQRIKMMRDEKALKRALKNPKTPSERIGFLMRSLTITRKAIDYVLDSWLHFRLPKKDERGEDVPYD